MVAPKSYLLSGSPVDVDCSSLPAKLYPDKLMDGYSRCSYFIFCWWWIPHDSLMTSCEYERLAGRAAAKIERRPFALKIGPLVIFFNAVLKWMPRRSFVLSPQAHQVHMSIPSAQPSSVVSSLNPPYSITTTPLSTAGFDSAGATSLVSEGPQLRLPKILYKIVQSLKFSKDCKIVMKNCNLA